ncbi:GH39 family glycosyl hydrolase [Levilactobacillus brevis]|uniref:GH39 family glycosyl hydrolase n=1 Tax=Levilactobacillus brevis TaxID=1580 RepID=UPI000A208E05|nr:xylan 1,4-beta-xylosidase [Levilactobacillus brevis]ARN91101.1 xylan 1,4-beta-xylosidase [Levilactobacillus brevis]ARN98731.1 xylan 1,4-beta-xylosidase [Levilactobacillus brevis]
MEEIDLKTSRARFNNQAFRCIGTGRLGLALQQEYQEELSWVQKQLNFQYIRGHGLFSDDVGIYHEYVDDDGKVQVEYNFTYLDRIMDSYQAQNIAPFLELGFMPAQLASGEQTTFYWQANVTAPKSLQRWLELVQTTLQHLLIRYGQQVLDWPIEIWNEPNLSNFWQDADMMGYFKLFKATILAIKQVNSRFQVGGPAICGVDDEHWLKAFIAYCEKEQLPIDFFTRHFYTVNVAPVDGHYRYPTLRNLDESFCELETSRKIIDESSQYQGYPLYISEFSSSYSPDAPLHDTVKNAAYVASLLARLGETSQLYSYWTFGDVFEEKGIPFQQFHGGFGLVAFHNIPKPTFWTFKFFEKLVGTCLVNTDHCVITRDETGLLHGLVFNADDSQHISMKLQLPEFKKSSLYLLQQRVDDNHANPLKVWHTLGEPKELDSQQIEILRNASVPETLTTSIASNKDLLLEVEPNTLTYFEIGSTCRQSDRGYDYQRVSCASQRDGQSTIRGQQ